MRALAPEARFSQISLDTSSFSSAAKAEPALGSLTARLMPRPFKADEVTARASRFEKLERRFRSPDPLSGLTLGVFRLMSFFQPGPVPVGSKAALVFT